jgi:HNH endonuclease
MLNLSNLTRRCYHCFAPFEAKWAGDPKFFCSRRCGAIFTGIAKRKDPLERFFLKVKKTDGCWLWVGNRGGSGYGVMRIGEKNVLAHRFSYVHANGPITGGLLVLHRCDNRLCVRPDHLFLGTAKDNTQDALSKGRMSHGDGHYLRKNPRLALRGSRNGNAKMNDRMVREIRRRAKKELQKDIARDLGISPASVSHVVTRRKWAHVV